MGFPFNPVGAGLVYNVKSYRAFGDGVHDDTDAWVAGAKAAQAGGGGIVYGPSGIYLAQGLPLYSGVRYMGAGKGATTLRLPSSASYELFSTQVPSGGSLLNSGVSRMTIDGNNTGLYGVLIDASLSNGIIEQGSVFEHLRFQNCYVGWYHGANNSSAGPMAKNTVLRLSEFYNCAVGAFGYGTYGDTWDHLFTSGCTLAGVGTYGAPFLILASGKPQPGGGPTTVLNLSDIHVEGLGNFSSGTDQGIAINASALLASNLEISNSSLQALSVSAQETGICNLIDGVNVYGSGGGVTLNAASAAGQAGILQNVSLSSVGRNTTWPGGYAQRQYPFFIMAGSWEIAHGKVIYYSAGLIPYNVGLGDGTGAVGQASVHDVSFPTAGTAFLNIGDSAAILRVSQCPGVNPVGSSVPGTAFSLPASGTAWTNQTGVDGTLFVTGAGVVTDVVVQGVTVASNLSVGQSFFVPAGGTITFTYSSAPTLVFVGN